VGAKLGPDIKGGTQTEGAEENIWTEERLNDGRLEETAY
jgi:hypothetical protein